MSSPPPPPEDYPTQVVHHEETVVTEPPPPERPDRGIWPWLLLLLVLVLAGLGAAYWLQRDDDEPQAAPPPTTTATTDTRATTAPEFPVDVPKVVGMRESEAVETLREANLKPIVAQSSSSKPKGVVIDQSPDAGATAERGGEVALVVSKGGRDAPPATTQATTTEATTQVTTEVTTTVTTQATTTAAPKPKPKPKPSTSTVPDLVGQELADAGDALAEAGLRAYVRYVPSDEPKGTVVEQAKEPGTNVKRDSSVGVNVAIGPDEPPMKSVPDVLGKPEKDARDALRRAGFEIRRYEVETDPSRRGEVLGQQPRGQAPQGALVLLYVGV